jgi:hypothetical protein
MAKYLIVHRFVGDPDEGYKAMNDPALINQLVEANGKATPGRCLFTWVPYQYGRKDYYGFCLWEASSPAEIEPYLADLKKTITVDILQVDEIPWP